jgi:hypothetical protein
MKKCTVFASVTAAPAAARLKVNKSGSLFKLGLDSLAVIRVPTGEEERARHWSRQREQLVHHRQKIEAQSVTGQLGNFIVLERESVM